MIPESVYSKYSQAMFDIAQSDNSLDTVLADMKTVRTVMRENENLYVMVDRRREAAITEAVENFIDLARAAQNIEVAKIRVIKPLTAEEETALVKKLETMTGKKIEPMYYTDPSILGGVVIQIGDQVIDGSLKRQIRNMEHALLQGSVANEVTD